LIISLLKTIKLAIKIKTPKWNALEVNLDRFVRGKTGLVKIGWKMGRQTKC